MIMNKTFFLIPLVVFRLSQFEFLATGGKFCSRVFENKVFEIVFENKAAFYLLFIGICTGNTFGLDS